MLLRIGAGRKDGWEKSDKELQVGGFWLGWAGVGRRGRGDSARRGCGERDNEIRRWVDFVFPSRGAAPVPSVG
jgi:hypothetical protein